MTPMIGRTLSGFYHRVDLHMEGVQLTQDMLGQWEYPPLGKAMAVVGIEEVETYVLCH